MDSRMTQRVLPMALAGLLGFGSSSLFADSLSSIYELALQNDASLKAAEATYRANIETENSSRAALLPQISANAYYSDTSSDSDAVRLIGPTSLPTSTSSEFDGDGYGLSLSQTLFDLSAWFRFQSGKETSKQAKAEFASAQQELIIRVTQAYFNVLTARETLEATRAEERAVKRQLEQTQQRFDVGLIAITDVHEARAVYDSTVARRLGDEATVGTALEALTVLTGQTHNSLAQLRDDFPVTEPSPSDRSEWVQFALDNNFDLKAALYAAQAAQQNAKSRKADHLPTLTGRLSYNEDTSDGSNDILISGQAPFSSPIDDTTETEQIRIELSVPLFSGGNVSAARRQAYQQYNATLQQSIFRQRQVVQQVRSLHLTVSTDVQRIKARKQGIVSAESALDATKAGYEVGTRNIVDVLQAQRSLFAAIRDYANARFEYVQNMLKLKQQAGTLSPDDIYNLEKWLIAAKAE